MSSLTSSQPFYQQQILAIVRIITASMLIFHGMEVFDEEKMKMYTGWFVDRKYSQPALMPYSGKVSELAIGIAYLLGFLTRIASVLMIFTFGGIIFLLGDKGNIFEGDQHPFMFVLIAIVFLGTGPGAWSIDKQLTAGSRPPKT
ncbi:MAG TPA: DoxX family protein [Flavitalea sp.]|nr:DoxX family protein [Flavitalea sp.]